MEHPEMASLPKGSTFLGQVVGDDGEFFQIRVLQIVEQGVQKLDEFVSIPKLEAGDLEVDAFVRVTLYGTVATVITRIDQI